MSERADDRPAGASGSVHRKPALRASDADRMSTVLQLQDAMGQGLLNPDEGGERISVAFAAVHLRDLDPLTEDLPPAATTGNGPPGWKLIGTMAVEQMRLSVSGLASGGLNPARAALALVLITLLLVAVGTVAAEALLHEPSYAGPWHYGHH